MVETTSRRAFVGSAVAGAALLAPLAWLRFRKTETAAPGEDGIRVVHAGADATARAGAQSAPKSSEITGWEKIVGQPFAITAAAGTLSAALGAIIPTPVRGPRPAGIRQQPFSLHFALDAHTALTTDGIYDIVHASVGSMKAFLQPKTIKDGKAMLVAVFD